MTSSTCQVESSSGTSSGNRSFKAISSAAPTSGPVGSAGAVMLGFSLLDLSLRGVVLGGATSVSGTKKNCAASSAGSPAKPNNSSASEGASAAGASASADWNQSASSVSPVAASKFSRSDAIASSGVGAGGWSAASCSLAFTWLPRPANTSSWACLISLITIGARVWEVFSRLAIALAAIDSNSLQPGKLKRVPSSCKLSQRDAKSCLLLGHCGGLNSCNICRSCSITSCLNACCRDVTSNVSTIFLAAAPAPAFAPLAAAGCLVRTSRCCCSSLNTGAIVDINPAATSSVKPKGPCSWSTRD